MGQKLSSLVFNGPRAKTKTVLEMAYKMDPKSSIIQSVSACWCRLSLASGYYNNPQAAEVRNHCTQWTLELQKSPDTNVFTFS